MKLVMRPHTSRLNYCVFLRQEEVRRLGATHATRLDFRIIAATHQPLEHHIAKGTFRSDLYYRLQGFEVTLPALKKAKLDILPLGSEFLREINPDARLSSDAKEHLMAYDWPGNIEGTQTNNLPSSRPLRQRCDSFRNIIATEENR